MSDRALSTRSSGTIGEGYAQIHCAAHFCDLSLFLTLNAVAPGNGLQAFQADRGITVNANAETAIGDALQCSLNQTQAAAASAGACKQRFLRSRKTRKVDRVERSWACNVPYFRFGFLNRLQKLASLFVFRTAPRLPVYENSACTPRLSFCTSPTRKRHEICFRVPFLFLSFCEIDQQITSL